MDTAWHILSEKVTKIMDKHAPLKTYRVKARNNPLMNRDILLLLYKRAYLCEKAKRLAIIHCTRNLGKQEIKL